ncbi:RNA recognition motif domain-containing protein [Hirsutella rhossiliensis]|uniref:RNA recognition motif domain-containing protein n=1 Tax=Hirsutella rhossiliensis TaxID=111463 RepID=A0A9P8MS88_9HYPO|nr:RNA recognition motif domain-containing protein [Hirsutella rhossiliensis]KAH0960340.1 RNA recognition motif domain-containing protein [Hirsutella rhossiliensis]
MTSDLSISTVYAQNLEERVKLEPLTEALKSLFSEFGSVVDVVARKNVRARGQAFIVFDCAEEAENAIDEMQGFELFGKPMKLSLAQSRSDKTVEMKCTDDEYAVHKRHRQAEKDKRRALEAAEAQRNLKRGATGGSDNRPVKLTRPSGLKSTGVTTSAVIPDEYLPPNKILFLQNVPDDYDVEGLTAIFGRFDGFREIRLVPGRRGIAFVEYEAEQGAIAAKENTAGMTLKDKVLKVTYQRQ